MGDVAFMKFLQDVFLREWGLLEEGFWFCFVWLELEFCAGEL